MTRGPSEALNDLIELIEEWASGSWIRVRTVSFPSAPPETANGLVSDHGRIPVTPLDDRSDDPPVSR